MARRTLVTVAALLALASSVLGQDQDCQTNIQACADQFDTSSEDERCPAYHEFQMCIQGVNDMEQCQNFDDNNDQRLRSIVERYGYCADHSGKGTGYTVRASQLPVIATFALGFILARVG